MYHPHYKSSRAFFFLFCGACAYRGMWVHGGRCPCVCLCICVWRSKVNFGCHSPCTSHLISQDKIIQWPGTGPVALVALAESPTTPFVSASQLWDHTYPPTYPVVFWILQVEIMPLCLHNKYFTDWVIFPAIYNFLKKICARSLWM